ncbi:MAG TPA: hypothetical protein PKW90_05430 [Myxococcota bacterium]|nr:hypothetical protein [Myxococcota bacterium]
MLALLSLFFPAFAETDTVGGDSTYNNNGNMMKMVIFDSNVPIDEEHTLTLWIMLRDFFKGDWADGNARARTLQIFREDQPVVESQRPKAVPLEMSEEVHVKSDALPLVFRKMRRECLLERGWGVEWAGDRGGDASSGEV